MSTFEFTNDWFETTAKLIWDELIPEINPRKILEVGSYEGKSACYLIDKLAAKASIELHCIDLWADNPEHSGMASVEERFRRNIDLARAKARNPVNLVAHKGRSDTAMAKLLADGKASYFDFIYIDGSHAAPEVLSDAVLGFKLLRIGGVLAFDDYLWGQDTRRDVLSRPKIAVDAFVNINVEKLEIASLPNFQLFVRKLAD